MGATFDLLCKMHPHKLQHFLFEVHSKLAVSPDDVTQSHDVSESDIEIQPLCKGPLGAIVCKALKIKEKKKKNSIRGSGQDLS